VCPTIQALCPTGTTAVVQTGTTNGCPNPPKCVANTTTNPSTGTTTGTTSTSTTTTPTTTATTILGIPTTYVYYLIAIVVLYLVFMRKK